MKEDTVMDDKVRVIGNPELCGSKTEKALTLGFWEDAISPQETSGDSETMPVRRSKRLVERTGKLMEFISAAKPKRGGRRSAPVYLESYDPPYQPPTFAGDNAKEQIAEGSCLAASCFGRTFEGKHAKPVSVSNDVDSDQYDSDDLTLKELQLRLKRNRREAQIQVESEHGLVNDVNGASEKAASRDVQGPEKPVAPGTGVVRRVARTSQVSKQMKNCSRSTNVSENEEDTDGEESSCLSSSDPDAIYCVCRQKHNKRFMICCDSCDEWFHGDCVGITEARGQQMEETGEEYICPNCTPSHNQPGAAAVTDSGAVVLSKCIGPGCDQSALPDSVYCSQLCILQHAAATMKTLTSSTGPKPTQKPNIVGLNKQKNENQQGQQWSMKAMAESSNMAEGQTEPLTCAAVEPADLELTPSSFPSYEQKCNELEAGKTRDITPPLVYKASTKESPEEMPQVETTVSGAIPACAENHLRSLANSVVVFRQCLDPCITLSKNKTGNPGPGLEYSDMITGNQYVVSKKDPLQQKAHPISSSVVKASLVSLPPSASSRHRFSHPHNKIRHDVCQSFTEILQKRIKEMGDREMSDKEAKTFAVCIESEICGMFPNAEHEYINKYKSVLLKLKDTTNKNVFQKIASGELTAYRLVRLNMEEFLSKEMSELQHNQASEPSEVECQAALCQEDRLKHDVLHDTVEKETPALCGSICVSSEEQELQTTASEAISKGDVSNILSNLLDETTPCYGGPFLPDEELVLKKPRPSECKNIEELAMVVEQKPQTSETRASSIEKPLDKVPSLPEKTSSNFTFTQCVVPILPAPSARDISSEKTVTMASPPKNQPWSSSLRMVENSSLHWDKKTVCKPPQQEIIWKGFIVMPTVAKFAAKAYLISGTFEYLKDLPDTLHIDGRITPHRVWDYIGKLKISSSKMMCQIHFYPATKEEEADYFSLFTYFSERGRFGVVANSNRHVRDFYIIPFNSADPIMTKHFQFEAPGLEPPYPKFLLGLVVCQKCELKRSGVHQEHEEKRRKMQIKHSDHFKFRNPLLISRANTEEEKIKTYNHKRSMDKSCALPHSQSSVEPSNPTRFPANSLTDDCSIKISPTSESATPITPLQTILNILFGKKDLVVTSSETAEEQKPQPLLSDPIVQKFGWISEVKDEDDRPYDPEEEYDIGVGYGMEPRKGSVKSDSQKDDDVAYDPEDDTIFDELKDVEHEPTEQADAETLLNKKSSGCQTVSLIDQQRMIEQLNREIEDQKRELEEQEEALRQQRAAIGISMAHFSVSDALMSPPSKSFESNSELLELDSDNIMPLNEAELDFKEQDTTENKILTKCKDVEVSGPEMSAEETLSLQLSCYSDILKKQRRTPGDGPGVSGAKETNCNDTDTEILNEKIDFKTEVNGKEADVGIETAVNEEKIVSAAEETLITHSRHNEHPNVDSNLCDKPYDAMEVNLDQIPFYNNAANYADLQDSALSLLESSQEIMPMSFESQQENLMESDNKSRGINLPVPGDHCTYRPFRNTQEPFDSSQNNTSTALIDANDFPSSQSTYDEELPKNRQKKRHAESHYQQNNTHQPRLHKEISKLNYVEYDQYGLCDGFLPNRDVVPCIYPHPLFQSSGHQGPRKVLLATPTYFDDPQYNNNTIYYQKEQHHRPLPRDVEWGINEVSSQGSYHYPLDSFNDVRSSPIMALSNQSGGQRGSFPSFHSQHFPRQHPRRDSEDHLTMSASQEYVQSKPQRYEYSESCQFSGDREQSVTPMQNSGPLLPTPLEGPIQGWNQCGHNPDTNKKSNDRPENRKYHHLQSRNNCGSHYDPDNIKRYSYTLEERQSDVPKESRRGPEQCRGPVWEQSTIRNFNRGRRAEQEYAGEKMGAKGFNRDRHKDERSRNRLLGKDFPERHRNEKDGRCDRSPNYDGTRGHRDKERIRNGQQISVFTRHSARDRCGKSKRRSRSRVRDNK